jgi:uncharacterized protein (TIGR02246 family)
MRLRLPAFLGALILFQTGLTLAASPSDEKRSIRAIVTQWDSAWNSHDMKAMASLLTEDADFVNVAGLHWKGKSQIEAEHAERHRTNLKDSTSSTREVGIQLLAPRFAIVHIEWTISGDRDFDGTPREPREGIFTWLMVKQSNQWLIRAAQTQTAPRANSFRIAKRVTSAVFARSDRSLRRSPQKPRSEFSYHWRLSMAAAVRFRCLSTPPYDVAARD